MDEFDLSRFCAAQTRSYAAARAELTEGRKRTHWMWYVFPILRGLGKSYYANFYGISGIDEARAYLSHELLGARLRELAEILLQLPTDDAVEVFGKVDAWKLKACMTLFDRVAPDDVFAQVLKKFFQGRRERRTLTSLTLDSDVSETE